MKTIFRLSLLIFLIASFLTLAAYAQDYYIYDAGDLQGRISFAHNMSMLNGTLLQNNSAYVSTGPLQDDYASTNDTAVIIDFKELAAGIKIKEYPVIKIGYKAKTEVEDTQITINVTVKTEGKRLRASFLCKSEL